MMYVIVFLFFFILSLMFAGIHYFGPRILRTKSTTTIDTLEKTVKAVISWSEANNRQLANSSNFPNIIPYPTDSYGQPLYYIYDNDLTSMSTGGICGKSTTYLTVNYCPNALCANATTTIPNVAFIVLSSGANLSNQTAGNQGVSSSKSINIYDASVTINNNPYDDIVRVVTLNELKSRAHCSGVTRGRLLLLNNELPRACAYTQYAAAIYPDGGVPNSSSGNYQWCLNYGAPSLNGSINVNSSNPCTCNSNIAHYCTQCYCNPTLTLAGAGPGTTGSYPVTAILSDYDPSSPAVVQRNYVINVLSCGTGGGAGNSATAVPGGAGASGGGGTGGINTGSPSTVSGNTPDSNTLANNIVPSGGSTTGLAVQNNAIEFGFNVGNAAACIWYPYNFPLLGKTLRAFWNFCFNNIDTSVNSTAYADGYALALMQANNPTSFCGTGSTINAAITPYNCQYGGALGEFLSYCGLPGYNIAAEFDIFPNNTSVDQRNDPGNSDNHVAFVQSLSQHTGPPYTGIYGDNTHDVWGNPACGCNGTCSGTATGGGTATCTGTCNGTAVTNAVCSGTCLGSCTGNCTGTTPACNGTCTGNCTGLCNGTAISNAPCTAGAPGAGTCYGTCSGTCNGTGLGCAFGSMNNSGHTGASAYPVTWMEDGCQAGYTNHNARVEVHTRCNATCSVCETSSCTSTALMKVWVDGNGGNGNNNLTVNEPSNPDMAYCFTLPSAMNQVKVGFTEGTGAENQLGYIANFEANFFGVCPRPTITATSLPRITAGSGWTATFSATGGTPPYTWSWNAANLTNPSGSPAIISSSTLPAGCTTSSMDPSTGTISCRPTSAGPYNTVLVSVTDGCTSDACSNTVSMNPSPTCSFAPNPISVIYNNPATLTWTITNSPANGTWTTSPSANCATNLSNSTGGGSCTTGNITASTTYPLTVTNDFGSNTCVATVNMTCPAPSFTTSSLLPTGTQGSPYSEVINATGGVTPYTWSASTMPPGLTFNTTTHTISGTPSAAGTYTFTISVTGSSPCANVTPQTFTIQIYGPPTCQLNPGSNIVAYNSNTSLTWNVQNGATSAVWNTAGTTPSPIGTCGGTLNPASGSGCTTGSLITPGLNTYTLKVSNTYGSNTCSANVYVGCTGYRVWTNIGTGNANRYDFLITGVACRTNINGNSGEITNGTPQLTPGGTINRYTRNTTCGGASFGSISYNDAMDADIGYNGGNGNCQVYYNVDNVGTTGYYGSSDTASDR